jgi:hypothetical protein
MSDHEEQPSYGDLHAGVLDGISYLPGSRKLHARAAHEVLAKLRGDLPIPEQTPRDPDTGDPL